MYYNNTHALRGLGRMTARTQENLVKLDWVLSFSYKKAAHRAGNTMGSGAIAFQSDIV